MELFHLSRELRMTNETYPRDMVGLRAKVRIR
jgi:hypothetical protein